MRRMIIGLLAALAFGSAASAQTHVRGYTRSDGTYVAPHYRSSPNSTTSDNYSTRGNVNPYTGQLGTKPDTKPSYGSYSTPSTSTYGSSSSYGSSYGSSTSGSKPKSCTSIYGC
jgi:hypothetical protein